MSDSEDELADYSEPPVPRATAHSKPSSRRTPASSTSRTGGTSKSRSNKRAPTPIAEEDASDDEVEDMVEDGDVEMTDASRVNGTGKGGRGKAKARGKGREEVIEEEEEEPSKRRAASARPKAAAPPPKREGKAESDLRKRLDEVTRQRDTYAEQFDALSRLKHTEAELALDEFKLLADERSRAQQSLIAHLQSQISHLQELNRDGRALPISLLPSGAEQRLEEERKAFELERRELGEREREARRVQESLRRELDERDELIAQLRDDLSHSRPISKSASSPPRAPSTASSLVRPGIPPATPASKHLPTGQTKNSLVVCLYEDLTNLLVTSCKQEQGRWGPEEVFLCVLTSGGRSLQFQLRTLRTLSPPSPPSAPPAYIDQVVYTPLALDQEKDQEWVEQLDFLGGQFTFRRDQMHVFLAQLTNHMPEGGAAAAE